MHITKPLLRAVLLMLQEKAKGIVRINEIDAKDPRKPEPREFIELLAVECDARLNAKVREGAGKLIS